MYGNIDYLKLKTPESYLTGCVRSLFSTNFSMKLDCGGGLMVSAFAFYSVNPSSIPALAT